MQSDIYSMGLTFWEIRYREIAYSDVAHSDVCFFVVFLLFFMFCFVFLGRPKRAWLINCSPLIRSLKMYSKWKSQMEPDQNSSKMMNLMNF